MAYLTPRALNGLRNYRFESGGYTILDTLHTPFWNWVTARLPLWLAPNLITFTGLIGVLASYLITAWYLPDFIGEVPAWVMFMSWLTLVVYVNLDNIDGKQAAVGQPCGPAAAFWQMALMVPWSLAQLEEYHTGTLLYGNGYIGVMESNYTLASLSLVSAMFGVHVWDTPLRKFLPFLPFNMALRHANTLLTVVGSVSITAGQLGRLLGVMPAASLAADERGYKQLGRRNVVLQLAIMGALIGMGAVWQGDVDAAQHPGQCRLASATYGLAYALVNTQLIMAHMAKEPFTPSVWAIAVVALGALNSVFHWLPTFQCTLILGLVMLVGYLRYATGVVQQVCSHLNINCFTIKHEEHKEQ